MGKSLVIGDRFSPLFQVMAGGTLMISRFFLAQDNLNGWSLAIVGSIITIIIMWGKEVYLDVVKHFGFILLSLYGLYKWRNGFEFGYSEVDYLVVLITILVAMGLCWRLSGYEKYKSYIWYEMTFVLAGTIGMVLLSLALKSGWIFFLVAFVAGVILLMKKKLYWLVLFQALSVAIAVDQIVKISL